MPTKTFEEVFAREKELAFVDSKENNVAEADRTKYLRIGLFAAGLIFIIGLPTLTAIWPSGWAWHTGPGGWSWHAGHSDYLQMILGVYATLGVFLLIASRNPLAHLSLIWFTVWSSAVHAAIMGVQAFVSPGQMGHLCGDVPALLLVAAALAVLTPRKAASKRLL